MASRMTRLHRLHGASVVRWRRLRTKLNSVVILVAQKVSVRNKLQMVIIDPCHHPPLEYECVLEGHDRLGVETQLRAVGPQDRHVSLAADTAEERKEGETFSWFVSKYDHHHPFQLWSREYQALHPPRFRATGLQSVIYEIPLMDGGIRDLTLQLDLPPPPAGRRWVDNIVFSMIERVRLIVDGVVLQTFSGKFIYVNAELTVPAGHRRGYAEMTRKDQRFESGSAMLPLPFWFSRNGTMFPLCALRRGTRVVCEVLLHPLRALVLGGRDEFRESVDFKMSLICELVQLGKEELSAFRKEGVEILIEEVQEQEHLVSPDSEVAQFELLHNRSTKRIHWVIQDAVGSNEHPLFGNRHMDFQGYVPTVVDTFLGSVTEYPRVLSSAQIFLGNEAREPKGVRVRDSDERVDEAFYRLYVPYRTLGLHIPEKDIYTYTFALQPTQHPRRVTTTSTSPRI